MLVCGKSHHIRTILSPFDYHINKVANEYSSYSYLFKVERRPKKHHMGNILILSYRRSINQPACFRKSISTPSPLAGVSRTACLTAALQPVMAVMIKHNSLDPGTQMA
jgi:hypothetical protein